MEFYDLAKAFLFFPCICRNVRFQVYRGENITKQLNTGMCTFSKYK